MFGREANYHYISSSLIRVFENFAVELENYYYLMRLIKLKSYEQEEVFVKLHPRLVEPFSELFPALCGILSSIPRLDKPGKVQ